MSIYVSSRVWRSCGQAGDRLLLMLALADFANDEGICWPSQNSLAKRCRCSRRGIQRMLDGLIEDGDIILRREGRAGGQGKGMSAAYQLARYSELGELAALTEPELYGDPGSLYGDPGAIKGRSLPSTSGQEPKKSIKESSVPSRAGFNSGKLSDPEFILQLKHNPIYAHIDILREIGKMESWLLIPKNRRRKLTASFMVNWLNKIEGPMKVEPGKPAIKRDEREISDQMRSWLIQQLSSGMREEITTWKTMGDIPQAYRGMWFAHLEKKRAEASQNE